MENKIKVIDLIDIKEKPKHIKVNNVDFYLNKLSCNFRNLYLDENSKNWYDDYLLVFNEGIEIIEEVEKSKEIEKVIIEYDNKDEVCKLAYANTCYELSPQEVIILDKIEELRKAVNYLLKKDDNQ